MKTILIVSLATNFVLLGALAYIQSLSIDPSKVSPVIFLINRSNPEALDTALKAAGMEAPPH